MTADTFNAQMKRLTTRFGLKALDQEFCSLVWRECAGMTDFGFTQFVDVLIGSRKHNDPPRLQEFRDAVIAENKRRFENDVRGAANTWDKMQTRPMKQILRSLGYAEANTLAEAVEVEREIIRLNRQIEAANGPKEGA